MGRWMLAQGVLGLFPDCLLSHNRLAAKVLHRISVVDEADSETLTRTGGLLSERSGAGLFFTPGSDAVDGQSYYTAAAAALNAPTAEHFFGKPAYGRCRS